MSVLDQVNVKRVMVFLRRMINESMQDSLFTRQALQKSVDGILKVMPAKFECKFDPWSVIYDNNAINFTITIQPTKAIEIIQLNVVVSTWIEPNNAYFVRPCGHGWETCTLKDVASPSYVPHLAMFGDTIEQWAIFTSDMNRVCSVDASHIVSPDFDDVLLTEANIELKR